MVELIGRYGTFVEKIKNEKEDNSKKLDTNKASEVQQEKSDIDELYPAVFGDSYYDILGVYYSRPKPRK